MGRPPLAAGVVPGAPSAQDAASAASRGQQGDIVITSAWHRGTADTEPASRPSGHAARRRPGLRHLAAAAAAAGSAALAAGCGAAHAAQVGVAANPRPPAQGTGQPVTAPAAPAGPAATPPPAPAMPTPSLVSASGSAGLHFGTPQAAMTYLAAAYNRGDITALHHVTEPRAFRLLMAMRSGAVNLRLTHCTPNPRGDYTCYFRHDFPASEHQSGHGQAVFIAAPALNPGWYMYQFQSCD